MEKINNLNEAEKFIRDWAKKWSQSIVKVEYESYNHLLVELSKHSVVYLKTLIELEEKFEYVSITSIDNKLYIVPYIYK